LLELLNLDVGYRKKAVLRGLNLTVAEGEVVAVLGANGIGKTTMFRTILGNLPPVSGSVTVDGQPVSAYSHKELAQKIGYIPQTHTPPFPYTVLDVVTMGRAVRMSLFSSPNAGDEAHAYAVLEEMGIERLAGKIYTEISGGERQLVLIARALTQNPELLIMDEPTAFLDFGNRILLLTKLRQLASRGVSVMFTTHDPDHALQYADRVLLINNKRESSCGPPEELITSDSLRDMYGTGIRVHRLDDGSAVCLPRKEAN